MCRRISGIGPRTALFCQGATPHVHTLYMSPSAQARTASPPSAPQLLSVVVPCYNESEVIEIFYKALKQVLVGLESLDHEIVFVDDGSVDDTLDRLNRLMAADSAVRVCSLSRNFGHQIALTAGMDAAVGDAVIIMDSDMQHPPSLIPELVRKWRAGYDVVSAIRQQTDGE